MRIDLISISILLIAWALLVPEVKARFHKSRSWHEELVPQPGQFARVLYTNFKTCVAPREKPEQVVKNGPSQLQGGTASEDELSYLMAIYSTHAGYEIYSWNTYKRILSPKQSPMSMQILGLFVFVTLIFTAFILFACYIPVVGCFLYTFCHLAWSLIFHAEMRRICRRILITKEKIYNCLKSLMPRMGSDRVRTRRHFRLAFILREYPEEEVPAELLVSDEGSEAEHSSDGFEDLLIRIKGREAAPKARHKSLVQIMASAEEEDDLKEEFAEAAARRASTPGPPTTT